MAEEQTQSTGVMRRKVSRRGIIGGSLAAASIVATYAALGDPLSIAHHEAAKGGSDPEAITKESVQISHLLRRAGFGVTRQEFDYYQSLGLKGTQDELINYKNVDDSVAESLVSAVPSGPQGNRNPALVWMTRVTTTKRPLQEKMVLFWHGLLTSQLSVVRDPEAMIVQNQLYRDHALDAFPVMLKAVSADPAMMTYLNIDGSNKTAPNENYARELMELFSLGVGNYTETDVREGAKAFTGWQIPRTRPNNGLPKLGEPAFRPQRFDSSNKTFLGKTGNFKPDDIVDIITAQPASANYITRRLFSFFIYPEPSDADIKPFVDVYTKSSYNIGAVVDAMLRSDVFYSPKAYRAIVKSPIEYAVSAVKALDLQNAGTLLAAGAGPRGGGTLSTMGQIPFEPPNVAGWPGNSNWLNSATMFARLNFLNTATNGGTAAQQRQGANARQQAQPSGAPSLPAGTTAQALDHYLPMAVDDNLPPDARQALLDYGGGADANLNATQLRSLAYLVLGSPQFHLS